MRKFKKNLAQDALVKASVAEQAQIQSQLDSMINGEQSQVASLRAQLANTSIQEPDGTIHKVTRRTGAKKPRS